jgi:hypothetical protein
MVSFAVPREHEVGGMYCNFLGAGNSVLRSRLGKQGESILQWRKGITGNSKSKKICDVRRGGGWLR